MTEGADSLREQRKRETARALIDAARRLTSERGFAGFTIEELCTEIGVSRRTFFNYFESKENAVFGFTVDDSREKALQERFAAQRGDLLDDFVEMMIRRFEIFNPIEDTAAMFAVIEQEPRLLKAAFTQLRRNEQRDMDLIVRREGDGADVGLRAEVVVHTVGALARQSMDQLLRGHPPESFRDLLTRRIEIARSAFTPSQKAD